MAGSYRWWPDALKAEAGLFVCAGTTPTTVDSATLLAAQIVLCHKDILFAWVDVLLQSGIRLVVFDEAHLYLAGPVDMATGTLKSRTGKAAAQICAAVPYRVALTGTPLTNRPKDLYSLINTLSPGRLGPKPFFYYKRYCNAHQVEVGKNPETRKVVWDYSGSSNEPELKGRTAHFILRRTKAEVSKDLPPLTRQTIDLEVLQKFQSDPGSAIVGGRMNEQAATRQLSAAADGKLPQVAEAIYGYVQEGRKVVAFGHRRELVEALADALKLEGVNATFSHGGLPLKERLKRIDSRPDALCVTWDTASVGISLTWADVVAVAELSFEVHKMLQGESRVHRPGQAGSVNVIYFIGAGTADELVRVKLLEKVKHTEKIIGAGGVNVDWGANLNPRAKESYEESMARLYASIQKQRSALKTATVLCSRKQKASGRPKAPHREAPNDYPRLSLWRSKALRQPRTRPRTAPCCARLPERARFD